MKPLIDLGKTVKGYGLEKNLMELVKIRASQINGCGVCLDMHSKEARKAGETEERMLMLSAWRETTLYNEREKAALAWTEALTRLPEKGAPDEIYEVVQCRVQRRGADRADLARRHHQQLQPDRRRLPRAARLAAAQGRVMAGNPQRQDAAASFDPLRPTLLRVAYRMMGSIADAEDVVQDAFLRWMATDRAAVRQPESFLRRTVTRLCLDQLKSARRRREVYPGEWLPEPVVESDEDEADDVTLPLMMALERLSPLERAAFILHDVFGVGFDEVAETLGRDVAACRQLAARARSHVREDRPRFDLPKEKGLEIAEAFFKASRSGDMTALSAMLAADVSMHADGGGKKPATMKPMLGFDAVMNFHTVACANSLPRTARASCACRHQRPAGLRHDGSRTTRCRRPRSTSATARFSASTSCAIPTS